MMLLAYGRPFWPLFLHVLGAMTLFGAILAAVILSGAAWRAPDRAFLRTAIFWALISGIPDYIVLRGAAQWIVLEGRLQRRQRPHLDRHRVRRLRRRPPAAAGRDRLRLLVAARRREPLAGRIVAGLSSLYLVLLAVAWLAMSGKWG